MLPLSFLFIPSRNRRPSADSIGYYVIQTYLRLDQLEGPRKWLTRIAENHLGMARGGNELSSPSTRVTSARWGNPCSARRRRHLTDLSTGNGLPHSQPAPSVL